MDSDKKKEILDEIKDMDIEQLEQAKKDIEEIISRINSLIGENNND